MKEDSIFRKQRSKIELIASLITIFVFVTGINSIPSLFYENKNEGIFTHISTSFSVGIVLISQVAFFVSFYIIIQYFRYKFLPEDERQRFSLSDNPRASFMAIILFVLGMGISFLFIEGFWGSIENIKTGQTGPTLFGILSFILNLATVVLGLELELD